MNIIDAGEHPPTVFQCKFASLKQGLAEKLETYAELAIKRRGRDLNKKEGRDTASFCSPGDEDPLG